MLDTTPLPVTTRARSGVCATDRNGGGHRSHERGCRGEPHRSELAGTTAASLANAVYVLGQQVGLVTNGRDAADRIRVEGWEQDYRTRLAARQTAMRERSEHLDPVAVETRRGVELLERIREALARVELSYRENGPAAVSFTLTLNRAGCYSSLQGTGAFGLREMRRRTPERGRKP